jgi:hypothetical protein
MKILRVLILSAFVSCGGQFKEARTALATSARTLTALDHKVALEYGDAADDALVSSGSMDEYSSKMEPWNKVQEALEIAKAALLSVEAAFDVAEKSKNTQTIPGEARNLGCALLVLGDRVSDVGVPYPPELSSFAKEFCE